MFGAQLRSLNTLIGPFGWGYTLSDQLRNPLMAHLPLAMVLELVPFLNRAARELYTSPLCPLSCSFFLFLPGFLTHGHRSNPIPNVFRFQKRRRSKAPAGLHVALLQRGPREAAPGEDGTPRNPGCPNWVALVKME